MMMMMVMMMFIKLSRCISWSDGKRPSFGRNRYRQIYSAVFCHWSKATCVSRKCILSRHKYAITALLFFTQSKIYDCCFSAVIHAKSYGMNLFYLVFVDPQKNSMLYVTVKGEKQEIIVTVRP